MQKAELRKAFGLVALVVGSWLVTVVAFPEPVPQWQSFHDFADSRVWCGVPNLLNVLSNLPFLLVGLAGLRFCNAHLSAERRLPWMLFFGGVAWVCFGSAYYHWSPDDFTLAWDRLPLTVGFMALLVALVGDFASRGIAYWLRVPTLLLGGASVAWWLWFDDVRLYFWVQFMPLLVIPVLAATFEKARPYRRGLIVAVGWYVVAKLFELFDRQVMALTADVISGHSVKHLLAAFACWVIYKTLRT